MKNIFNYIVFIYLIILTGCANKPPNIDLGFTDKKDQANFTYTIQGKDFKVDNAGHNYTLHGQNLTYDQMRDLFFYMSPWAWGDMKNFLLNYCHQNPSACTYEDVAAKFIEIENRIKAQMQPETKSQFENILEGKQIELKEQIAKYDKENTEQ